jgi:uncharacterized protein (TIGR03067 family)
MKAFFNYSSGLLIAILAFGLGGICQAEVLELEGTVKSIDAASRSISISRKTPKGEKVLELEVAKNAGDISGFKEGDTIAFAYNPDVDIISKIEKGLSEEGKRAIKDLEGVWKVTAEHEFGRELTKDEMRKRNRHITIKGNSFRTDRVTGDKLGSYVGSIQIDPERKTFDFIGNGPNGKPVEWIGIYKTDGDALSLCYRIKSEGNAQRPSEFKSVSEKPGTIMFECKREE